MVENNDNDVEVKCIFCEKDLERSKMVRYRGAISCRECAEKQKQKAGSNPIIRPFFYLAGIGCLIGMLNFIYFTFDVYLYSQIDPASYIQPLGLFFGGMVVTIALMAMGLYAINRVHLYISSIVGVLTGIVAAASSVLAVYDFVTAGPYYVIEMVTYTKTISYYPTALVMYAYSQLLQR
ncbi:MAG: ATP synthase subunit I [Candidatus Thorarchaeota archaeon]